MFCSAVREAVFAFAWMALLVCALKVFDVELGVLEPLPTRRPLLRAVRPGCRFRVGRPKHDHVAILQAVLDRAVSFRLADAQRISPVMDRAPVPAFP